MLLIVALSSALSADSTYATDALRALVARASDANRRVPAALAGYEAQVESELSLVLRLSDGRETVAQIEQTASDVRWDRTGSYEQRVTGYRARSVGPNISALSYMTQPYTVPLLYGNRLLLLFGEEDSAKRRRTRRARPRDSVVTIHPFSAGREAYYRFEGGDTVSIIETAERRIPITRIRVHPSGIMDRRTWVFDGEIDLDADRAEIVRMRGAFVLREPSTRWVRRVSRNALEGLFVIELVNAEVAGRYWLPSFQRIEGQVLFGLAGDTRSVLRVVSAFRGYDLGLRDVAVESDSLVDDTLQLRPKRLTYARRDSLDRFDGWVDSPGQLSAPLHADDFMEFAPETWRPRGRPIVVWRPERGSEIIRFNRVEGLFTGVAASVRFRDRWPGASVGGSVGWAWSEEVARGEARARWVQRVTTVEVSGGRALASTNDFRRELDFGATLSALIASVDDYDYVDRRFVAASVTRAWGRTKSVAVGVSGGVASDWPVVARLESGPIAGPDFRINRGIIGGRYHHFGLRLTAAPQVGGESLRPGAGLTVTGEVANGDLRWRRVEVLATARHEIGRITVAGRGDAGLVDSPGPIPPQRLFELGGSQGLYAYDYKTFAGDRAALLRAAVLYDLGFARAPLRIGRLVLPGLAPMLGVTGDAGWTSISSAAAAQSVAMLGATSGADGSPAPMSRETDGIRSSIEMGLRFFGGAIGVGVTRAVDHRDEWRPVVTFSQMR